MVTKNDYISLLNSPHLISDHDIVKLKELQSKYPYSGDIQMLLTKGYHKTNSVNYEEQLKKTAISVSNREALYTLIYKVNLTKEIEKEEEGSIQETVEDSEKERKEKIEVFGTKKENTEEYEIKKTTINEIVKNKANDKLEQLILSHAIGASYVLEDKDSRKTKKEAEQKESKQLTKTVNKEHHSFYSWLIPLAVSEETEEEKKNPIDVLVEKFIESKGSDKIKRKEFFSPTNVAKLSIVETDDFVTETLAGIYVKQQMYEKALRVYDKLILKNPEKKTYFAGQIKKIKSLLEQKK